jgi:hypothetical protein
MKFFQALAFLLVRQVSGPATADGPRAVKVAGQRRPSNNGLLFSHRNLLRFVVVEPLWLHGDWQVMMGA